MAKMVFFIVVMVCLAGLVIGAITDIRTREVPDWINYSLIAAGVGFNLIFSIVLGMELYCKQLSWFFGFFYSGISHVLCWPVGRR